jgi:succinate dehydrogenase hydrophobic anchor subunit
MELSISRNRTALVWLVQATTGILLIILLILHLVANHFVVPGGLQNYQDVVNYLSNPIIFVLEITFLVVVTGHALLGVRAILIDRGMTPTAISRMDNRLWIIGAAAVIYGILLSILIVT